MNKIITGWVLSILSISLGYYAGYSNGVYNSFQQKRDNVSELESITKSYKNGSVTGATNQIKLSLLSRKSIFEEDLPMESEEIKAAKADMLNEINSIIEK